LNRAYLGPNARSVKAAALAVGFLEPAAADSGKTPSRATM
jgi:hypothetical protein